VTSRLDPFFRPRSIAVVGAGERPTSSGGAVLRMLRQAAYAGRLVPINPRGEPIFGLPTPKSLHQLDQPVELVVVVVRPDSIADVVSEAAATGHKHLLILPGGFAESGPDGVARERRVAEIAAAAGITIAGPNCAGLINLRADCRMAATFLAAVPPGGGLALVSQSGALAEEVIARAIDEGMPLSTVVSVGNALHLGIEDYLEHLGEDADCRCILLYCESLRDRERFAAIARRVVPRKPVVALMPGRTTIGRQAARAHTGADSPDADAMDRFLVECGVLRVDSLRHLLMAAKGFGAFPEGIGRRVLVLSNSGGPGVLAADRAAREGLELAPLPEAYAQVLRQALPGEASVANPIDLLADAREERFDMALGAALAHARSSYDAILMIHVVPFMVDAAPVIERLAGLVQGAGMPIMHSMMGTLKGKLDWFARMEAAGCPMFDNVEAMAETAALLARYRVLKEGLAP
jgi:acyl-CoA synthetase (NDP forming)